MNCSKVTIIGGEPCTGKSTLMKQIIKKEKINEIFEYKKLLKGHQNEKIIIIGLYEDQLFDGTDRLSMAVQPVFIEYLKQQKPKKHIILEGDRLFKKTLFDYILKTDIFFRLIILECSENIKKFRHIARKDEQSQKWLDSKKTTIQNIKNKYSHNLFRNENMSDCDRIIEYILSLDNKKATDPDQFKLF
jgi:uridine kinase